MSSFGMGGMFIGAALAGTFADKFGRKKSIYIWVPVLSVLLVCHSFVTNLTLNIIIRTVEMIIAHMAWIPHISYCVEIVGPKGQAAAGVSTQIAFAFGYAGTSLLGMFFPDWREFTISTALVIGSFTLTCFLVPNSPRFMYSSGQYDKARESVKQIAKKTGTDIDDDFLDNFENEMRKQKNKNTVKSTYSTIDLFTNGKLLTIVTIIQSSSFFTCCLVYYGMTLNAAQIPGDLYVNNLIGALIEVVANLATIPLLNKLGRKTVLSYAFFVCGFFMIASTALIELSEPDSIMVEISKWCAFSGKFAIVSAFSTQYVTMSELYFRG